MAPKTPEGLRPGTVEQLNLAVPSNSLNGQLREQGKNGGPGSVSD